METGVKFQENLVMIKCHKCQKEQPLIGMVYMSKDKKYVCDDEKNCKSEEEIKKEKDKQTIIDHERVEHEKFKNLPPSEYFRMKYNKNYDELEELSIKFRDGCIYYYHQRTHTFYKWNFFGKYWDQPNSEFSLKYLISLVCPEE